MALKFECLEKRGQWPSGITSLTRDIQASAKALVAREFLSLFFLIYFLLLLYATRQTILEPLQDRSLTLLTFSPLIQPPSLRSKTRPGSWQTRGNVNAGTRVN